MWIQRQDNRKPRLMERYTDPMTGKSKIASVTIENDTTSGRKKAEQKLVAKLNALTTTLIREETEATLADICEEYLLYLSSRGRKKSTYLRCQMQFRQFQSMFGSDTLCKRFNARFVSQALDRSDKSNAWKNETIKRLKALFGLAHRRDMVSDISWLSKLEPYPEQTKREKVADKFLEQSELRAVLDSMTEDHWWYLASFLALSGLRVGEAIALDLDDVDMENRLIHVTKTFSLTAKQTTAPKTFDSLRDVYIQDELYKLCHQIRSDSLHKAILFGFKDRAFIRQGDGKRANYDHFRIYFKRHASEAVGRPVTPHILRHTMTSLFAEQGIPLEVIQRRLGHSDSDTTREIYLHITEQQKKKDYDMVKEVAIL